MNASGKTERTAYDLGSTLDAVTTTAEANKAFAKLSIAPEVLKTLSADFARKHRVLPLALKDGVLDLATADPGNQRVIDDIRLLTGFEVREVEYTEAELMEKIGVCYQITFEKMIENLAADGVNVEGKNLHYI